MWFFWDGFGSPLKMATVEHRVEPVFASFVPDFLLISKSTIFSTPDGLRRLASCRSRLLPLLRSLSTSLYLRFHLSLHLHHHLHHHQGDTPHPPVTPCTVNALVVPSSTSITFQSTQSRDFSISLFLWVVLINDQLPTLTSLSWIFVHFLSYSLASSSAAGWRLFPPFVNGGETPSRSVTKASYFFKIFLWRH